MPRVVLRVHSVPIGETETGLWCERCLLPSVNRFLFAVSTDTRPLALMTIEVCAEQCSPPRRL